MIKEFKYYIDNSMAKKSSPDIGEAEALIAKAEGRLKFSIRTRKLDENTAPYIFEDVYECLREAAQSLMSLKGYKPYSHEALISFLKEFFDFPDSDIASFDRYRIMRNKTVYRGEKVSLETCKAALAFLLEFLPKIKNKFESLSK
jgi:uncharacterized protein (UPF0332 family)